MSNMHEGMKLCLLFNGQSGKRDLFNAETAINTYHSRTFVFVLFPVPMALLYVIVVNVTSHLLGTPYTWYI